jgi:sortase A
VDDLPSLDEEVGTGEGGEPAEQDDGSGQADGRRHGTPPSYGGASGNDQATTTLRGDMDVRRIVAGIGRTCIAAGMLILAFVAYQLWGTGLAESRSQDRLRSDFLDALETPTTTSTTASTVPGETTTTMSAAPPTPTGEAVAIIRIPKIGVEKAVVEGVGVNSLKQGPGHYPTTPLPGQPGNAAIAGHRTTYGAPFYRTDELEAGDLIQVTTRQGEFTYKVREKKVVRPTQNDVLLPSEENLLTLTTCNPRFSAAQRLIIVSELTDNPAPAPPPPVVEPADDDETPAGDDPVVEPTLDEASVSGDDTAKLPAILWGLLAAFVWFVTWLLSKRWGRLTAYVMGTPVFVVVLFVFFENFARLLPANV